jgi:hypothetical protein
MTMNEVWLALALVVSHIVQLVLDLQLLCANILKPVFPSDSFHLEESSHELSASSVVRNWHTKLCFQVSWKDIFTQSTHIYARRLQLIKHSRLNNGLKFTPISDKAQETSYAIAEIMARKEMKSHTIVESVILPACCCIWRGIWKRDFENPCVR